MSDASAFTKLVPGFDFLQGLVKNAGAALPSIGQWVAPTLNPEELEKRIDELRTVQFWLEQNARMLGATIQALEVQRMTLSTLKTMNVQMSDLRDSLQIKLPETPAPAAAVSAEEPATRSAAPSTQAAAEPAPPAVDPMQWWGALTKQFTQLATTAMQESGSEVAKGLAGSMLQPGTPGAAPPAKKAVKRAPAKAARKVPASRKRASP